MRSAIRRWLVHRGPNGRVDGKHSTRITGPSGSRWRDGGGIYIECPGYYDGSCAGTVTLTANVIEQNWAHYNGGVYCLHDKLLIQNNIIRGKADAYGAATFAGSEITFVNNVVADNCDQQRLRLHL